MTSCPCEPQPEPSINDRRQALGFTYPGWGIACLASKGRWYASRRSPITEAQAAAGVIGGFWCDSYEEFVEMLAEQATLVDRCGGYRPP